MDKTEIIKLILTFFEEILSSFKYFALKAVQIYMYVLIKFMSLVFISLKLIHKIYCIRFILIWHFEMSLWEFCSKLKWIHALPCPLNKVNFLQLVFYQHQNVIHQHLILWNWFFWQKVNEITSLTIQFFEFIGAHCQCVNQYN